MGETGIPQAATLAFNDALTELPISRGSIGPDVIDVCNLYRDAGYFTYDPGFTSTANCTSSITYIDGDKGELLYRGYPIDQLAENSNFLASGGSGHQTAARGLLGLITRSSCCCAALRSAS